MKLPSESRATISVKVPPLSIANRHFAAGLAWLKEIIACYNIEVKLSVQSRRIIATAIIERIASLFLVKPFFKSIHLFFP